MTTEDDRFAVQEVLLAALWGASGVLFVVSLVTSVAIFSFTATEQCPSLGQADCFEDKELCPGEKACFCLASIVNVPQSSDLDEWQYCHGYDFHMSHTAELCYWTTRTLTFVGLILLCVLFVFGRVVHFRWDL